MNSLFAFQLPDLSSLENVATLAKTASDALPVIGGLTITLAALWLTWRAVKAVARVARTVGGAVVKALSLSFFAPAVMFVGGLVSAGCGTAEVTLSAPRHHSERAVFSAKQLQEMSERGNFKDIMEYAKGQPARDASLDEPAPSKVIPYAALWGGLGLALAGVVLFAKNQIEAST
jgi:hypothetical protein